jgi:hypothetical protein
VEAEVLQLLKDGNKIQAVKLYMERTGTSLLEAKQAVEAFGETHGTPRQKTGCLGVLVVAAMLGVVLLGIAVC